MADKESKKAIDKTAEPNVWIFQGNPLVYRVYESLCDESLKEDTWLVSRYAEEIRIGDIALIWKARRASGIYAVGEIISNPQMMRELPESSKYWIKESDKGKKALRVLISYKLRLRLTDALFKDELARMPELKNMQVLRQSQGTNFRVTALEGDAIQRLLKERYNFNFKQHSSSKPR